MAYVSLIPVIDLQSFECLIIERSPEYPFKRFHDWSFISETHEPDDPSPRYASMRGVFEEVGIVTHPGDFWKLNSYDENETCVYVTPLFLPRKPSLCYEIDEVGDTRWTSLSSVLAWTRESPYYDQNENLIRSLYHILDMYPKIVLNF